VPHHRSAITTGDAIAQLFDDLHAADGVPQQRDAWVTRLTAVERFLETLADPLSADSSWQLRDFAFRFCLFAEILYVMPVEQVERLFAHRVIRRLRRAVGAACVEALIRRGWERKRAAGYIGVKAGVATKTAIGWRDTLERERRKHSLTFENLHDEQVVAFNKGAGLPRHQRKDVAAYVDWLDSVATEDEDALIERIDAALHNFGLEKIAADRRG
jgi:hypothetical protein